MKRALLTPLIACAIFCISCNKEITQTPQYPIEGLWIGTFSFTEGATSFPAQYFSYIIKPDGKMIVELHHEGVTYFATGTWTLTGDSLLCRYTFPVSNIGPNLKQISSSAFDKSGKLTGTWSNANNSWQAVADDNQKGSFSLSREN